AAGGVVACLPLPGVGAAGRARRGNCDTAGGYGRGEGNADRRNVLPAGDRALPRTRRLARAAGAIFTQRTASRSQRGGTVHGEPAGTVGPNADGTRGIRAAVRRVGCDRVERSVWLVVCTHSIT